MKSQDGVEKVRAKVLIIKGDQAYAVCKRCNSEVALPLTKTVPTPTDSGPRLYLEK